MGEAQSKSREAKSEAEDAQSKADEATFKAEAAAKKPTCKRVNTLEDLEAGWVGIGSSKNCHPLNGVAKNLLCNNRAVIRRSQRITRKITMCPIQRPRNIRKL